MADKFDPYREALVVETRTIWPEGLRQIEPGQRAAIEQRLQAEPDKASELAYVRLFTGFSRQITVTAADLERLKQ